MQLSSARLKAPVVLYDPTSPSNAFVSLEHGDMPTSLSERAYLLIREQIISLKLKPGAIIEESKLMAELGIGRTPIREALKRLTLENLVRIVPRHGMFVGDINITDLAHISEARTVLEGYAARVAAARATERQRAKLRELLEELRELKTSESHVRLIRIDQGIHLQMYQATHNHFLARTLEQYFDLALRIWFLALPRVTRLQEAVQEHQELLRALLKRDGERAEYVIRQHIAGFHEEIKKIL